MRVLLFEIRAVNLERISDEPIFKCDEGEQALDVSFAL